MDEWDSWVAEMKDRHGNGNGHGRSLSIEARKLLPTPKAHDSTGPGMHGHGGMDLPTAVRELRPEYEPAFRIWQALLGRPAPSPLEPGKNGNVRLASAFVEWMMGLPEGHVTGVPDLSRSAQIKALGNGVVPQQAELAVKQLMN